jgi:hypothetical protein
MERLFIAARVCRRQSESSRINKWLLRKPMGKALREGKELPCGFYRVFKVPTTLAGRFGTHRELMLDREYDKQVKHQAATR